MIMLVPIGLLGFLGGQSLAAPTRRQATSIIYDGSQVSSQTFDYVIAGGGLAGNVLASRLAEDTSRKILVIEAGYNEEGRAAVTEASQYGATFGTWLDWQYQTVPQTSANGQPTTMRSGRALGGSTIINGMAWSKPHTFQLDAFEQVGNPGLNWNSLQTYMKRVENFQTPSSQEYQAGWTYDPQCHGTTGTVSVQGGPAPGNLEHNLNTTAKQLGLPWAGDLTCGNPAGLGPIGHTQKGNLRIDAYRAYLYSKAHANVVILAGANVGKVRLSTDATPRATGVEFRDQNGNTYTVSASREVIMATGSIKTPVILQQSGIGPSSFLSAAGVPVRVNLPIGQNLIDQVLTTTTFRFSGSAGGGSPITFPRFQDLLKGNDATTMRNMLQNNLGSYAQAAVNAGAAASASALQKVLEIQRDWILNKGAGMSENYDYSYGNTFGWDSWFLLPFGRGSIRINNADAYSNSFSIDPRFFSNAFDRLAQGASARFTRTACNTSPLNSQVNGEQTPGSAVGGNDLETWASWTQNNYRSNWHPIGTAAMMSKDLGGCVDSRHRVYGVNGLRIVDGSNLPFQVSSHLMSVLYGLAERAAELIKADNSGSGPTSTPPTSTSTSTTPSSSPTAPAGKAIHPAGAATKCLQVQGSFTNGASVAIADCNNQANQRWAIAKGSGAIQVAGQQFCLDAGDNPANGIKMKIWQCYTGIRAQTWTYSGSTISLPSLNQCLDLTDGSTANGNVVQTWQCYSGNSNQQWST